VIVARWFIAPHTVNTQGKAAYQASRGRLGITREAVWIQLTPGADFAVFLLEADDLLAAFGGLATSRVPFDH
jgi:hypothetical protein